MLQEIVQPLAPQKSQSLSAAADSDQTRAMAEVQAQMILAKKFPRDEVRARDRILNSCARKGLAEVSQFCFSRGGKEITGPSIDLMVVIAAQWGNITHGWRELSRMNGASEVEAFAWDVETNTKVSRNITVKHIRDKSEGGKPLTSERDINELCANYASRAVRTCLEKVIPPDITDDAVAQCDFTLNSKAEITPEKIRGMLEQFSEYGVTQEMIVKRVQRNLDTMTPVQMVQMVRIYKSLKDGMSKPEEWFDMALAKKPVVEPATSVTPTPSPTATVQPTAAPEATNPPAPSPTPTASPAPAIAPEAKGKTMFAKNNPASPASALNFGE